MSLATLQLGFFVAFFLPLLASSFTASPLGWIILVESIYLGLGIVAMSTAVILPTAALQLCYVTLVVGVIDLVLLLSVGWRPLVSGYYLY